MSDLTKEIAPPYDYPAYVRDLKQDSLISESQRADLMRRIELEALLDIDPFNTPLDSVQAPMDWMEIPFGYSIDINLPGESLENIILSATDKELTIKVEHDDSDLVYDADKYIIKERGVPQGLRTIVFPKRINPDTIEVNYEHGVLELTIEFAPEQESVAIPITE